MNKQTIELINILDECPTNKLKEEREWCIIEVDKCNLSETEWWSEIKKVTEFQGMLWIFNERIIDDYWYRNYLEFLELGDLGYWFEIIWKEPEIRHILNYGKWKDICIWIDYFWYIFIEWDEIANIDLTKSLDEQPEVVEEIINFLRK